MKIVVLVDNNTYIDVDVGGEPGVSIYLEDEGKSVLLDFGISDLFLKNAAFLGVSLDRLSYAVLSHKHYDHTRGLVHWVNHPAAARTPLVAHPACLTKRSEDGRDIGSPFQARELAAALPLQLTTEPLRLTKHIYYLGEIPRVTDFEAGCLGDDPLPDDSALACLTPGGLFIVTGCSHAGICNIIEQAKAVTGEQRVLGVLGGFHLFGVTDQLRATADYFEREGIRALYPCHCVDFAAKAYLHSRIPIQEVASGMELQL
ncbi:MAG: MBL fold metallo-hydrolase [Clostridia bacterium]|nr:MBL fold metallo-hydrolase [Clostridia bacterium]